MAKVTATTSEDRPTPGQRLDHALDETRERVGRVVDTARGGVQTVMDGTRQGVETMKDKLGAIRDKRPADLMDDTLGLVREHPGTAALICVGAGFLVGWLLRGRE
jgi:ElaB/YqjD/DUF883 family membrane-anchored ribosome-binding protein